MSFSHLLVTFVYAILISQSAAVEFEFLKLVFQWGPTVCEDSNDIACKISPILHKLTIHGIWPSTDEEPQPRKCKTTKAGRKLNTDAVMCFYLYFFVFEFRI